MISPTANNPCNEDNPVESNSKKGQRRPIRRQRSQTPPVGCLDALKQITCSLSCGGTSCSIHETSDVTDSPSPEMRSDPAKPSKANTKPTSTTRKRKSLTKTSSSSSEGGGGERKKRTPQKKRVKLDDAASAATAAETIASQAL